MSLRCFGFTLALMVAAVPAGAAEFEFVELFNGENLEGWTQRNGTATYRIEDDAIVGKTSEGSPNSFLCTDQEYGDFELKFEVLLDSPLNSGVQIRSQSKGGEPSGRVNGPQVEISTDNLAGYVYGEAAGGWMTPEEKRERHNHFKEDQWNEYHVIAVGPRIQVWLNGHQISDLVDEEKLRTHPKGFIGLQVHGIGEGKGPYEVRWRNIKLRDLSGFKPLYNGENLSGWKTSGNWLPQEDGSLLIQPRPGEKGWQRYEDYLVSEATFGDFVLDLEYAYPPDGNSGVFFRIGDPEQPVETGIEVQILDSSKKVGEMTHHDHGGVIRVQGASKNMSRPPHAWNRMIICCVGEHLEVELNGTQIIDLELDEGPMDDRPQRGHLALQDHGEPNDIRFRNIRVKRLE